jgi:hypothetical protein
MVSFGRPLMASLEMSFIIPLKCRCPSFWCHSFASSVWLTRHVEHYKKTRILWRPHALTNKPKPSLTTYLLAAN